MTTLIIAINYQMSTTPPQKPGWSAILASFPGGSRKLRGLNLWRAIGLRGWFCQQPRNPVFAD